MHIPYKNPVTAFDFADPFVLQAGGEYFAYATALPGPDGRIFPVLHSSNLVNWQRLQGALKPLVETKAFSYWAPEVAEKDGRFYLFYSASASISDEGHRLRVATSANPAGPFVDSGRELLPEIGFSIDASPFRDPMSGRWFLYFAMDYEADEPYGTGLAVAQLADDLLSVVSPPTPVIRAQADWQIYERNRNYKGRVWPTWACVEGPNVVFHDGRYYCFYSGGAWHGDSYGVGFAVAENPLGPWSDTHAASGASVLRARPGVVIGPGHNSCVMGPDGQTLYMVYHAWDPGKTARRMCIDPIVWTPDGPRVEGPSTDVRTIRLKRS